MNFRQIKAIEQKNKERILKVCPHVDEQSGIYVFYRTDENGIKHAYVGQAKSLITRLAQHLIGYQHIDLSIKKHGFFCLENTTGYEVCCFHYPIFRLDEMEQHWIKAYANNGYQLKNKTSGSQGVGKKGIAESKPSKGYNDGLKQGYKNAQIDVAKWMKWLTVSCDTDKKLAVKAKEKFDEFVGDKEKP